MFHLAQRDYQAKNNGRNQVIIYQHHQLFYK